MRFYGKWEIKKDSLLRYYDKETLQTEIDSSAISFDLARKKMELTTTVTDENGAQTEQSLHYKRK